MAVLALSLIKSRQSTECRRHQRIFLLLILPLMKSPFSFLSFPVPLISCFSCNGPDLCSQTCTSPSLTCGFAEAQTIQNGQSQSRYVQNCASPQICNATLSFLNGTASTTFSSQCCSSDLCNTVTVAASTEDKPSKPTVAASTEDKPSKPTGSTNSLMCYNCTTKENKPEGKHDLHNCSKEETMCGVFVIQNITSKDYTESVSYNFSCTSKDLCDVSFTYIRDNKNVTVSSNCCATSSCNTEGHTPEPEGSYQCHVGAHDNKTQQMNCAKGQDRCYKVHTKEMGEVRGCASESACNVRKIFNLYYGTKQETDIKCCNHNLCNGAAQLGWSGHLLVLLLAPVLLLRLC
ncbi:urokinase plasminogen activator surface receptor-like [Polypterus senegalus]|uniref:urokinase plasminogen activator surface receptor-like n=1 Tax=Polypterus senegalus TaxID=55291 RepID=UPI0019654F25|nr:urokinase plasminogen activator surface receptor-like [Polypterus senegalus]